MESQFLLCSYALLCNKIQRAIRPVSSHKTIPIPPTNKIREILFFSPSIPITHPPSLFLLLIRLRDIEAQAVGVEVELVLAAGLLQQLRDAAGVLDAAQVDVAAALLDGVADEFRAAGLALRPHHRRLLLLPRLVHHEGGPLRFLLRHLLRFDGGREFGGEGEVLSEDGC